MKIKTVGEMIEALQSFDPETPIAMATQPSYPWAYDIGEPEELNGVVYLPERGNQQHVSRDVFSGW